MTETSDTSYNKRMLTKEEFIPGYLKLPAAALDERIRAAKELLSACRLCPRACGANRLTGEMGICRTGEKASVASVMPHFGEETPLVGRGGSGTIFITHCNLLCIFCQNYEISHLGEGREVTTEELSAMMLMLQGQRCHNINFVTPTHVTAQILAALPLAIAGGLHVPLVYNSSGYDRVETLRLLDGIIDIYMPDFKFWDPDTAKLLAHAPDYPERARDAIREMHRQVGDLVIDDQGIAVQGLLVRHLVMPGGLAETGEIIHFLATKISPHTYVNIMDQYRPCGRARYYPAINRMITSVEYDEALRLARAAGLSRIDEKDWRKIIAWM